MIIKRCLWLVPLIAALPFLRPVVADWTEEGEVLLFVPFFLLFWILATMLHELGHALVGTFVGLRVFRVSFGWFGRVVLQRKMFGIDFQFMSNPFGGMTVAAPRSLILFRIRWILSVAAGPLANILLAAGAYAMPTAPPNASVIVASFFWANILIAFSSLFPWKYKTPMGPTPSDGLAIISTLFASKKLCEEKHASYFAYEGIRCIGEKNYELSKEWSQKGLREYPSDLTLKNVLGMALLWLGEQSASREVFAALLQTPDQTPQLKAIFLNNVAFADLLMDDPALLDEADRYSQEAMQLTPWVALIKGTRGSVLVELGRVDEGIGFLKDALEEDQESNNKALGACCLAIALIKKGNNDEGRQYLEQAQTLDPDCPFISRVLRELS